MFLEGQINWMWVLGALAVCGHVVAAIAIWFAIKNRGRHVDASGQLDLVQRVAEDSQKRLFETLNAIPVALVETDRQGKFVFANRAAHQLLGRRDAELIGLLKAIDHEPTRLAVELERAFTRALGGTCHSPVAALAVAEGDRFFLKAFLYAEDGSDAVEGEAHLDANDTAGAAALARELLGDAPDSIRRLFG